MMVALSEAASSAIDWRQEGGEAIAVVRDRRYHAKQSEAGGLYVLECDRGSGWRRVPGSQEGTLKAQVKAIARC